MERLNRACRLIVCVPIVYAIFTLLFIAALSRTAYGLIRYGRNWECGGGIGTEDEYDHD